MDLWLPTTTTIASGSERPSLPADPTPHLLPWDGRCQRCRLGGRHDGRHSREAMATLEGLAGATGTAIGIVGWFGVLFTIALVVMGAVTALWP